MEQRTKEEYAIVLDYLPNGYPFDTARRKLPVVQAIGKTHFVLLELIPKRDVFVQPHEEVYIGEGKRDKIHHISGKLPFEKLTETARSELPHLINGLVDKNEKRFVDFFNNAQPLSMRMHQIELLPGVGKKHMWEIIDERKEKPFESFNDIKKRVKLMPDPKKAIVKRIIEEIEGKDKHYLFVGVE
jgi:putative nucleotide binding protein